MAKYPHYIYFDHSATTPVLDEVSEQVNKYFTKIYGNASELHAPGRKAKQVLEESRSVVASGLGAKPGEIIFTGGGTESNNIAIFGATEAYRKKGNHIITSDIEHPSVQMPMRWLEGKGFKVTYIPVDRYGMVDPVKVKKAITAKTVLVSIMHANNVFGTIQPIAKIASFLKPEGIIFHTDAVQSFCNIRAKVDELGVDLLSVSGHKIYGPKGIGALYIRKGTRISPFVFGGGQEQGIRPGTENIPGIAGLAKATEIAQTKIVEKVVRLTFLREYLIEGILKRISGISLCGHPVKRLPGNCNFTIKGVTGQAMVSELDKAGIAVSGGSACSSSSRQPPGPLLALGLTCEEAYGSIRVTLGFENTIEEIDYFLEVFPAIVESIRAGNSVC
ncbi:MAG: cysteine desulfurase family protein [Candidatus Humimicrobiaceae bacterium]